MTIDLPGGAGGRRDAQKRQRDLGLRGGVAKVYQSRHEPSERITGPRRYYTGVGRNLDPREEDLMSRSKNRAMIGTIPAQGRSTFAITQGGSTRGLVEHRPKRAGRPPLQEIGPELTCRDIAEKRVEEKQLSRIYTTETGERRKYYEKQQRGDPTPGPGEYNSVRSSIGEVSCAAKYIEETRGFKTDLDWHILKAAEGPSAAEYGLYVDPRHSGPSGGNFNMGNSKNDIDIITYVKRDVPGPDQYRVPDGMEQSGLGKGVGGALTTAPKTDYSEVRKHQGKPGPGAYQDVRSFKKTQDAPMGGGRISASKSPSFVDDTVRLAKETPGVGNYNVRKEEMELPEGGRFGLEVPMDTLSLSIQHLKGNPGPGAYYRDFQVGLKTNESRKRERRQAKAKAKAKARIKKEREEAEAATERQVRRIAAAKEAEAAREAELNDDGSGSGVVLDGSTADASGYTHEGSSMRPSTAGDMTGGGGSVSFGGSSSRPSTVDGSSVSRAGLRSRQSLHSSVGTRHSSSLSSVFTVLDDTQSALGNFAAQVEWQLSVNEKPRDRYVADVDPKDGHADSGIQSSLAIEDLKPLTPEEWDALYPPPPEPKRDARYYMKKKKPAPAPEPEPEPEPEPAAAAVSEPAPQSAESAPEPEPEPEEAGADEDDAAVKIQAVFRGRRSRRYGKGGRSEALSDAKESLAAAEAAWSKEEAEAIAAEAEAAREEAEAVAAEAAHAKEEAEAIAAEADAKREEDEAVQAEADAARELAEAEAAEKDALKEEEEAREAQLALDKEAQEAEEARIVLEREEDEAIEAAETAARERAEADAALDRKIKEEQDVIDAQAELMKAMLTGDEGVIAEAQAKLEKEKAEAKAAAEEAMREEDEAIAAAELAAKELEEAEAARIAWEKEQQEAEEAAEVAAKEQEEAEIARAAAEKERAEAVEAAEIAERERAEAVEAAAIAEKERKEADEALIVAERERAEADAAAIVAARERAEADAAREEMERLQAEVKAMEEEEAAERAAHEEVVDNAPWDSADRAPPETMIAKKKKSRFGSGVLKKVLGMKDKGPPPGLHVRVVGSDRSEEQFGNDAMMLTVEVMGGLNMRQLIPAVLLDGTDANVYCTAAVCGAGEPEAIAALPSTGAQAKRMAAAAAAAGDKRGGQQVQLMHTTESELGVVDGGGADWNERFTLTADAISSDQIACGLYLQAEHEGQQDRKLGSVCLGLHRVRHGLPVDVWATLAPAPPTLHLRLRKIKVPPAVALPGGGGHTLKLRVDVLDAYGDLQGGESEVPDPYVRLRLNDDGEDKLSSILDNTLTPEWHDSFEFDLPGKYGRGKYAETFNDGGVPAMLNLSIWDKDTFGRDDLLGKFSLDVHLPELAVGAHEEVWLEGEGAGANLAFTAFPKPN